MNNEQKLQQIGDPTPVLDALMLIKGFACKEGMSIEFRSCNSGGGGEGKKLREWLENFFGDNAEIMLHETYIDEHGKPIKPK